ncbi:MAG: carboxypeptidase M32 [Rhodospirillales bacterium]
MSNNAVTAYTTLEARFRRAALLGDSMAMLGWDRSVMMPSGSGSARAEQVAALEVVAHETLVAPDMADLLDAAGQATLDSWQQANLREMRRRWIHATALTPHLVEARTKASAQSEMMWREARAKSDFKLLLPYLQTVLDLTREIGQAKASVLNCSLYDALLDEYEPGGKSARIDAIFADLQDFLPPLLQHVLEAQAKHPVPLVPPGPFPVEAQRVLGVQLMEAIGFDFTKGRLDISLHPFTGGIPDDIRITTRYDDEDFARSLMGVLHETGHALYEANLPPHWRHQPVGNARGMTLHESQSLLLEMQTCRSAEFITFAAPKMRAAFNGIGAAWSEENLHRIYTTVKPGLIRVDADEVTYPLHVMLRYRLERRLLSGDLKLADLPGAWNEAMKQSLGIAPPDDRLGCLQDIHWPDGAFGYFPTYTLGAMAAAQLFAAACQEQPQILPGIAKGDFSPLFTWLRANVHGKGSLLDTDALLNQATGAPLGTTAFRAHLERRYLPN